jgi:hypothetical protein
VPHFPQFPARFPLYQTPTESWIPVRQFKGPYAPEHAFRPMRNWLTGDFYRSMDRLKGDRGRDRRIGEMHDQWASLTFSEVRLPQFKLSSPS